MWNGVFEDRATAFLVPGDKVMVTGGEYKGKIGVFVSHKPKTVEVQMKRGEAGKFLRPYHVVPLDITSYAPAESNVRAVVHPNPKPQRKASGDLRAAIGNDEVATIDTASTPFSHVASASSGFSPKLSKLADLVEEEMKRIYHSIEVINALMQSMRMAELEDSKPDST